MDRRSAFEHQTDVPFVGASTVNNPTREHEHEVEHAHANEFASQVVAYTSPYLFWATVSLICAGYLILF